ncbi:Purine nucleoside phosphoramidase [Buchnera aphidicola (Tetraneura ulmi)]|uniref:HIT domain-containing protein n=1 Tax=Buchnera aphidicola TaxID=9 RepID=UPI003463C340
MKKKTNKYNIFQKIIKKEIKSKIIYQNDNLTAFEDINPKAPIHILIIPNKKIKNINQINIENKNIIIEMIFIAVKIAKKKKIEKKGYRLVINCNKDGGQEIPYLHIHLLGGRKLGSIG